MQKFLSAIVAIVLLGLLGISIGSESDRPVVDSEILDEIDVSKISQDNWYDVVKVVDGDTLAIDINGQSVTLRLIGLDTPETVHPSKPVECFGREASDRAKQLLSGQSVQIEFDDSQGTYDKYQRLLAYVYLPDGQLYNQLMITEGLAHEYTFDLPYRYQSEFKFAQQQAREQGRGFWAANACDGYGNNGEVLGLNSSVENVGDYVCSSNTYNCSDFATNAEAQAAYDACAGVAGDIHNLDVDGDGQVCESLP